MRQAIRSFRVDRIIELDVRDENFEIPGDFELQDYLDTESYTQPKILVKKRFTPEAASLAFDDRAYWESMEEQDDCSVIVTFNTPTLVWAVRTVLNFASYVEVLEPKEFRAAIRDVALSLVSIHSDKN